MSCHIVEGGKGSQRGTRSYLYILFDIGLLTPHTQEEKEAKEVGPMTFCCLLFQTHPVNRSSRGRNVLLKPRSFELKQRH